MRQRHEFKESNWDVIQGGMGVAVSDYRLARAAGRTAAGMFAGTAIAEVLSRRLQDGDPTEEMREALATFPNQAIAERALRMYFQEGGVRPDAQRLWYRQQPMFNHNTKYTSITADMAVLGAYAETYLAKKGAGPGGVVGMNLLTELDRPNMHELLGAMMAGVDFVGMGAGIPDQIPRLIHDIRYGEGAPVVHNVHVRGKGDATYPMQLDPTRYDPNYETMSDPAFLAIITHHTLAERLNSNDYAPDGYVIEAPTAGGHNAPARGREMNERGEPIYGERDMADLEKMQEMGLTYWLAGSRATFEDYQDALLAGARGIQVGTAFALTQESGWDPELKAQILHQIAQEEGLDVFTDLKASPTGFPFKIGRVPRTMASRAIYEARARVCDLGYLRQAQHDPVRPDKIEYVCPSEPVDDFLRKKTGLTQESLASIVELREQQPDKDLMVYLADPTIDAELKSDIRKFVIAEGQTEGRMCLCNGLMAAAGFAQGRDGVFEPQVVTIGDDANRIVRLLNTDESGDFHPEWPITVDRVLRLIRTGEADETVAY